ASGATHRQVVGELAVAEDGSRPHLIVEGGPGGDVTPGGATCLVAGEAAVGHRPCGAAPILHGPAPAAAPAGEAAAARDFVVRQRAPGEGGRAAQVVDGTAEVVEAHPGQGLVVAQGAGGHAQSGAGRVEDRAPTPAATALVEVHLRAGTV